jgi:Pyruvate/2-oxoacid:ferredoxin oxidoreductase delta subunit
MNRTAPTLTIHAAYCAHQRVARATCQACVTACPRQAWQLLDEGLSFDADRCDSCGLCVAACPLEALEIPAPTPIVATDGERTLWLACERAGIPPSDSAPGDTGFTPCLHALTPDWVLHWQQRHRITQLRLASGDCAACDRRPAETLQRRWQPVAERLTRAGRPAPALMPTDARQWQARANRADQPDPRRRRFLGQLLQGPAAPARNLAQRSPQAPLTSGRRRLVHTLASEPGGPAAPLWRLRLDPHRCTWCMACSNLCPEQALTQTADPDGTVQHLTFHPARCTGCALCLDVCDSNALALAGPDQPHAPGPNVFELEGVRCPVCRVSHLRLRPASAAAAGHPPEPCPTCRRGRPVRHDRVVQTPTTSEGKAA